MRFDVFPGYDIRFSVPDNGTELIQSVADRQFFLVTPQEALDLGPQQQILVEVNTHSHACLNNEHKESLKIQLKIKGETNFNLHFWKSEILSVSGNWSSNFCTCTWYGGLSKGGLATPTLGSNEIAESAEFLNMLSEASIKCKRKVSKQQSGGPEQKLKIQKS